MLLCHYSNQAYTLKSLCQATKDLQERYAHSLAAPLEYLCTQLRAGHMLSITEKGKHNSAAVDKKL